jgi:hypothetical protein
MIKEVETSIPFISVEKDRKIVHLYYEKECPKLELLYEKYGKKNVNVREIKLKKRIIVTPDENIGRRRVRKPHVNIRVCQLR